MKTIYFVFNESPEAQAMFSDDGELLDYWYSNDATWRDEYFSGFMEKLGIQVKRPPVRLYKRLLKQLQGRLEE